MAMRSDHFGQWQPCSRADTGALMLLDSGYIIQWQPSMLPQTVLVASHLGECTCNPAHSSTNRVAAQAITLGMQAKLCVVKTRPWGLAAAHSDHHTNNRTLQATCMSLAHDQTSRLYDP